jgi:hypothetical protein
MDKKLKKKIETQLVSAMEGVLSRINATASGNSKKKIKEAGKIVAKKFVKAMEGNKTSSLVGKSKAPAKKPFQKPVMPKRDANGKFTKKK